MIMDTNTFLTRMGTLVRAAHADLLQAQQSNGPCQSLDSGTQITADIASIFKHLSAIVSHQTVDLNAVCSETKLEKTMRILRDEREPEDQSASFTLF